MQLFHSPASPFVRKVMIVAREQGLDARIELLPATVAPIQPNAAVAAHNPLMKIPALVTDEGESLLESSLICQYLDALAVAAGSRPLLPAQGAARWQVLRMEAIADGLADAGILVRYETALRPEALRWPEWRDGQLAKVASALDLLEREVAALDGPLHLGHVAVAAACTWLEFRDVLPGARASRPALFGWLDHINATRPAFNATMPR